MFHTVESQGPQISHIRCAVTSQICPDSVSRGSTIIAARAQGLAWIMIWCLSSRRYPRADTP